MLDHLTGRDRMPFLEKNINLSIPLYVSHSIYIKHAKRYREEVVKYSAKLLKVH